MKKLLLIGVLAFYSHLTNGQTTDNITTVSKDSNAVENKIGDQEQKIVSQEQQSENFKKENKAAKKQLKQNKNGVVIGGGDKIIITRKGSKQWTTQ